jgi:hypothetical protein
VVWHGAGRRLYAIHIDASLLRLIDSAGVVAPAPDVNQVALVVPAPHLHDPPARAPSNSIRLNRLKKGTYYAY